MNEAGEQNVMGLHVEPLDENCIPLEAVVLIKCLGEDGEPTIDVRSTDGLQPWDRIGMLTVALDVTREDASRCWRPADDDEDEDDDA
jgi:hypothetical protein